MIMKIRVNGLLTSSPIKHLKQIKNKNFSKYHLNNDSMNGVRTFANFPN